MSQPVRARFGLPIPVRALVGALLLLGLAGGAPPGAQATPAAAPSAAPAAVVNHTEPYIQHVVIIVLENQGYNQVMASGAAGGAYEKYLAATYGLATNYWAACHPSAPNYLAMFAAVTNQCGSDNWNNYTNRTLQQLFVANHLTAKSYAEGLPKNACSNPGGATVGLFATRHVPFLYFAADRASPTYCKDHLVPGSEFGDNVVNGTLANFSFYTPNLCDDGHNGCGNNTTTVEMLHQADAWLSGFLPPILNHTGRYNTSAARAVIAHTLFVITYDEGAYPDAGFAVSTHPVTNSNQWCAANGAAGDAVCGGRIYTVFVSPYSLGRTFALNTSSFGLVRTIEWLFHLPHLKNTGNLDSGPGYPGLQALFSFKANGH